VLEDVITPSLPTQQQKLMDCITSLFCGRVGFHLNAQERIGKIIGGVQESSFYRMGP
jgi:hypothetical protein